MITPGVVDPVCFEVAKIRVCDDGSGGVVDRGVCGSGAVGVEGVGAGCSVDFGLTDAGLGEAWFRQSCGGDKQNPP